MIHEVRHLVFRSRERPARGGIIARGRKAPLTMLTATNTRLRLHPRRFDSSDSDPGFHFALFASSAHVGAKDPAEPVDFSRDVRAVLSDNCFRCHGPDAESREAGLRLDRRESAIAVRDDVAAIRPGDASASELIRRITSTDLDERMPPVSSNKTLEPD